MPAAMAGASRSIARTWPHRLAWARLGLAAGVLLFRVPTLTEPRWYSDEGFFTSVAWATSKGLPLYARVYDNSPPGIYWLYRILLGLGAGGHHVVVQLAAALAVLSAALLTFEIARRLTGLGTALGAGALTGLVLSLPTLDGDLLNVELAALPFFLGALALSFSDRLPAALAAGALLGAAVLTRPSFALDGVALLVPLFASRRFWALRLSLMAAGFALVLLAAGGALWAGGSLGAYVKTVLPSDHAYLVWANRGTMNPVYARLAFLGAAALVGFANSRTLGGRLLSLWIPASVAGATLTPRELTHYAHEAIPSLAIGAAMLASRIRWRWLALPAALAGVVAGAEAVLVLPAQQTALMTSTAAPKPLLHNFAFRELPAYYANWLTYATGGESWTAYAGGFPGSRSDREATLAHLEGLRPHGGGTLLVLGDQPWLYERSHLLPATPYVGLNSAFWTLPGGRAEVRSAMSNNCPSLVVLTTDGWSWHWDLRDFGYMKLAGGAWPVYEPSGPPRNCRITP